MRRHAVLTALTALTALLGATVLEAADPIFDQTRLHEVRIEMDPDDWESLRANYLTNQYYAVNISLDNTVVPQVGIRSRGTGSRDARKPGLKVDFNKYVSGQEFHGYKSLVLDNLVQDASLLRERLAFKVFEAMGIPAPQNAFARLTVNGGYIGVYNLVESVSKPFLKARFGDDSGNLFDYEYAGPYFFSYAGADAGAYVPSPFQPQTHEDTLDASGLIEFIRVTNEAPDATFVQDVGRLLDVTKFLTYLAVENALAEYDGFLGEFGMNNFYLYQFGGQTRFEFIPWDKDTSLSFPNWPIFQRVGENVLSRRLLADASMQVIYVGAVKKAVGSYLNSRWLLPELERAYTQIREAVLLDTAKPATNDEFELSVLGLRGIVGSREADVLAQAP